MAVRREDAVLLLVVYVVPLGLVSALLWAAGLHRLALTLLAVEVVVALAVVLARRGAAGRWWLLPLGLVVGLGAVTAASLLAGR